jgi:hypothetical protein
MLGPSTHSSVVIPFPVFPAAPRRSIGNQQWPDARINHLRASRRYGEEPTMRAFAAMLMFRCMFRISGIVCVTIALGLTILCPQADASGAPVVQCHLKADWGNIKTGAYVEFTEDYFNSGFWQTYTDKCTEGFDFHIYLQGFIDKTLEHFTATLYAGLKKLPELQRRLRSTSDHPVTVTLNSDGGDVDIALRVGRMLRELNAYTIVAQVSACRSSCVFLLAAGVSRMPAGLVGLHRPFFADLKATLSPEDVAKAYDQQRNRIITYLNDMRIPRTLLDRMDATPPDEMYDLSYEEKKTFQLLGDDPVYDERNYAAAAYVHGVTSMEFRRRFAEAGATCGQCWGEDLQCYHKESICRQAIYWGLSQTEYLARYEKAGQCEGIQRAKEPMSLAEQTCFRNAMLGK